MTDRFDATLMLKGGLKSFSTDSVTIAKSADDVMKFQFPS